MEEKKSFRRVAADLMIAGSLAFLLVVLFASCGEEETTTTATVPRTERTTTVKTSTVAKEDQFRADLKGQEEVPPVSTNAEGEAEFELSDDGSSMKYKVEVSDISDVTASHIHMGAAGKNGAIVLSLFSGNRSGEFEGILAEGTVTAADLSGPLAGKTLADLVTEIDAGNTYVNVHTTANPNGEIRGQIR